jgi:hypothetical protein
VISVELQDSDSAERLAQELSDRFPAAVLKQDGHWDVAVYRAGADSRVTVIAAVLHVLKPWLRTRGLAAARLRIGERRTYLLEAEAPRESVASHSGRSCDRRVSGRATGEGQEASPVGIYKDRRRGRRGTDVYLVPAPL